MSDIAHIMSVKDIRGYRNNFTAGVMHIKILYLNGMVHEDVIELSL